MLDASGDWHVTRVGQWASPDDVRPEECELDPVAACPDEAEKTRRYAFNLAYERIATRLRFAMAAEPGERMVVQFDPSTLPGLERVVQKEFSQARVRVMQYGHAADLDTALAEATAYIGLPAARESGEREVLVRWLTRGATRRAIQLHSPASTIDLDGNPVAHSAAPDAPYLAALDVENPLALIAQADHVAAALASGEVRVTTPAGTDVRFRVGERAFNRQCAFFMHGGVAKARMLSDRLLYLPAGLVRVAPVEPLVQGVVAIPAFRISDAVTARNVRLEFAHGVIAHATAAEGQQALDAFLASTPAATRFGEFALGLNPRLAVRPAETILPGFG